MTDALDNLHAPLLPILRYVLPQAGLPSSGWLFDLASGDGRKLPLMAEACGPGARLLALDRDATALRAAAAAARVVADSHALPLRPAALDGACCIAAIGLFAAPERALAELRRALKPGAPLLLVTAARRWTLAVDWPDALAAELLAALGPPARHANPDHGADLAELLAGAGFHDPRVRAFPLGAPDPERAELSLLPWAALRPRLPPALAARCESIAAAAEPRVRSLALAALAHA